MLEQPVRAVETLQCFAIPSLAAIQLRALAQRFGEQQRILLDLREAYGISEMALGLDEAARSSDAARRVASRSRRTRPGRRSPRTYAARRPRTAIARRMIVAREPQLAAVHLQPDPRRAVAERFADRDGFVVRGLGFLPAAQVGVQAADVVEHHADVDQTVRRAVVLERDIIVV